MTIEELINSLEDIAEDLDGDDVPVKARWFTWDASTGDLLRVQLPSETDW